MIGQSFASARPFVVLSIVNRRRLLSNERDYCLNCFSDYSCLVVAGYLFILLAIGFNALVYLNKETRLRPFTSHRTTKTIAIHL